MRAVKHATHSRSKAQEVFEISIARLPGKEVDLPVAATAEGEAITLFAWDDGGGKWHVSRIEHAPIAATRGVPSISNTWNWSRRLGLATFDDLICLVYKRADPVPRDEAPSPAQLMLETFRIDGSGLPNRVQRISVPMPSFTREASGTFHFIETVWARPGFELWAGVDAKNRKLLIVTQTLGERATVDGGGADLTLLLGDLDRLDRADAWTWKTLDAGGYGLDVRHSGNALSIAYRTTPHALRIPLPVLDIDSLFGGWPQLDVDASAASDHFFTPLRIMEVDLGSLDTATLTLPGGEHPRIQSVAPLLVTADRPQLRVRFRVVVNSQGGIEPQVDWDVRGVHKMACLLDDTDRLARGVLMSFPEGDRLSLPRTAAPWEDVQDLYTGFAGGDVRWASTWARIPLEPLRAGTDAKGLFFDFLHKSPWRALQRSRARLIADFDRGLLTVTDLRSLVYDINHAQFGAPDLRRPDATGENAQFAPFERLSQHSGNVVRAPSYLSDNTIGGTLVSDRDGIPYQFLSYTDLGDGGLRVVYDAELGPPDEPPAIEKPKTLEPESVPGPGSADERWIELKTTDWQDTGLPPIVLTVLLNQPTITSSVHAQIESLLQAGVSLAGLSVDEDNGWSEDQVNSIQTALNGQVSTPETRFSDDTAVPPAFIRILPPTVVADADTVWEAGIEGEEVGAVSWRFTFLPPTPSLFPLPVIVTAAGNPATVPLFLSGDWTVRADITRSDGSVRSLETVVTVDESLFRRIASLHRSLFKRGLEAPLSAIGNYRIGTATFDLLQYELRFPVAADELNTHRIVIKTLDKTDAQWRFRAHAIEQGVVDYRLRVRFESTDIRLEGLLGALAKVESVKASFFYGRSFTPAILMNDTRSAVPTTGADESHDGLRRGDDSASLPRLASALTARPYGDARITLEKKVEVKVSMLPQAIAAGVVTLLVGLGAATAAATLIFLLGVLGIAIAAAAAPGVGAAAAAAAVAAAVAVFLFIAFVVPPMVEASIADNVERRLTNDESVKSLEDSRLLQFAGEGVAEAIARQVIAQAIDSGSTLDPPPVDIGAIGVDRYRQDLYQMIHVSEGRCRVLIRG